MVATKEPRTRGGKNTNSRGGGGKQEAYRKDRSSLERKKEKARDGGGGKANERHKIWTDAGNSEGSSLGGKKAMELAERNTTPQQSFVPVWRARG